MSSEVIQICNDAQRRKWVYTRTLELLARQQKLTYQEQGAILALVTKIEKGEIAQI